MDMWSALVQIFRGTSPRAAQEAEVYHLPQSAAYVNESDPDCPDPVEYLDAASRQAYQVHVDVQGLLCKADGAVLDTRFVEGRSLFVVDLDGNLYCASGHRTAGMRFQHSSFLAGGPVRTAGELRVQNGVVVAMSNASGHYRPSSGSLRRAVALLKERGADVTQIAFEIW